MKDGNRRQLTPRELQRQRRKQQVQRRRLAAAACLVVLIVVIIVLVTTCGGGDGTTTTTTSLQGDTTTTSLAAATYTADLIGDETDATGTFSMTYDPDADELEFTLTVDALKGPSAATIYQKADDGSDAVVLYTLYSETAENEPFSGVLAQGIIDETKLTGTIENGTLGDLIALVKSGVAFVSVGTTDSLNAITGQIAEGDSPSDTTLSTGDDSTTDTTASDEDETTTTKKSTSTTKKTTTTT